MRKSNQRAALVLIFSIFFLFPALVAAADGPLIFGVGVGVFGIGLGAIFAILLCIFGLATPYPWIIAFVALLIPIILFLIFYLAPTESERTENLSNQANVTDRSFGWRVAFFILGIIGMLLALLFLFLQTFMTTLKAPRVDSGVIYQMRKQPQEDLARGALQSDRLSHPENGPDSPHHSFDSGATRSPFHRDSVVQRSPLLENEGLTRPRRRLGESSTSPQPGEPEEKRSLVRRRME